MIRPMFKKVSSRLELQIDVYLATRLLSWNDLQTRRK